MRHDQVAGRWTIKQIGLCEHGPNSSYLEGKSLHLPLHMTLKLKDLLQGNWYVVSTWKKNDSDLHCLPVHTSSVS